MSSRWYHNATVRLRCILGSTGCMVLVPGTHATNVTRSRPSMTSRSAGSASTSFLTLSAAISPATRCVYSMAYMILQHGLWTWPAACSSKHSRDSACGLRWLCGFSSAWPMASSSSCVPSTMHDIRRTTSCDPQLGLLHIVWHVGLRVLPLH